MFSINKNETVNDYLKKIGERQIQKIHRNISNILTTKIYVFPIYIYIYIYLYETSIMRRAVYTTLILVVQNHTTSSQSGWPTCN